MSRKTELNIMKKYRIAHVNRISIERNQTTKFAPRIAKPNVMKWSYNVTINGFTKKITFYGDNKARRTMAKYQGPEKFFQNIKKQKLSKEGLKYYKIFNQLRNNNEKTEQISK